MKFTKAKIAALAGGVVVAGGLAAVVVSGSVGGGYSNPGGSSGGSNASTSSYYQTGVAYADTMKGYYDPGFNLAGADAAPEPETPS
jgi:hypothetical protein